jgi:hypothetical protein
MERGYVRLYRKKLDSDIWRYINADRVFEFLMLSVTYRPHKYFAHGKCIDLQPGQFVSSDRVIAQRCYLTYQATRTAIHYLKSTQRITQEVTRRYSIYSILNWDSYQRPDAQSNALYSAQDNAQVTQLQRTDNAVATQKQELKELKEGKEGKKKSKAFTPPTIEEVTAYCSERNNRIDPQLFIDSNTAKGWVVGDTQSPMKDWRATIRTWERRNGFGTKGQHGQHSADVGPKAEPGKYDAIPKIVAEAK